MKTTRSTPYALATNVVSRLGQRDVRTLSLPEIDDAVTILVGCGVSLSVFVGIPGRALLTQLDAERTRRARQRAARAGLTQAPAGAYTTAYRAVCGSPSLFYTYA